MKYIYYVLFSFFLFGCESDEHEKTIRISDVQLIDKGQIHYEFDFSAARIESGKQLCTIRTLSIKKGDTIESIGAYTKGKRLFINIISYPYDFDCNADSCFSVHDVQFILNDLKQGEYSIDIGINNGHGKNFNYRFI